MVATCVVCKTSNSGQAKRSKYKRLEQESPLVKSAVQEVLGSCPTKSAMICNKCSKKFLKPTKSENAEKRAYSPRKLQSPRKPFKNITNDLNSPAKKKVREEDGEMEGLELLEASFAVTEEFEDNITEVRQKSNGRSLFAEKIYVSVGTQTELVVAEDDGQYKNLAEILHSQESYLEELKARREKQHQDLQSIIYVEKSIEDSKKGLLKWAVEAVPDVYVPKSQSAASDFMISRYMILDRTMIATEKKLERKMAELEKTKGELASFTSKVDELASAVEEAGKKMEEVDKANDVLRKTHLHDQEKWEKAVKENRNLKKEVRRKEAQVRRHFGKRKSDKEEIRKIKLRNRKAEKKVESMQQALDDLKEAKILSDQFLRILDDLPDTTKSLLKRCSLKNDRGVGYDDALKVFAMSLNFYSPAAYEYVRNCFKKRLPHRVTLQNWYAGIHAEPGFDPNGEAILAIKAKATRLKEAGSKLMVSLVTDDMSLREHVDFNGKKYFGLVDLGGGKANLDNEETEAHKTKVARKKKRQRANRRERRRTGKEKAHYACTFMVVSLKEHFRMPCGYVFMDKCDALERADLLEECILTLEGAGAEVENVTFDGAATNINSVELLGAEMSDINNLRPYFINPADEHRIINVTLDVVHMIKLIRNTFGDKELFFDGDGGRIEWKYIKSLNDLQTKNGLHYANKLTKKHVEYTKNKMKVRFATQTMSESVATAIEFCDKKQQLEDFADSAATVKFLRMMNTSFDWLNSSQIFGRDAKAPLSRSNMAEWTTFFAEAESYFRSLRTAEDGASQLLINSRRRTGFIGMIVAMQSAKALFDRLVLERGDLNYLLTYRLSQDHLEMFFGRIRRRNGCNNNPSSLLFIAAYKRLVVHNEIKAGTNGNVVDFSEIKMLASAKKRKKSDFLLQYESTDLSSNEIFGSDDSNAKFDAFLVDSSTVIDVLYGHSYVQISECDVNRSCISEYLAGYVALGLFKKEKCANCRSALKGEAEELGKYSFLSFKTRGKLFIPSQSVVKICKLTEKKIREQTQQSLIGLLRANIPLTVSRMAASDSKIFKELSQHALDLDDPLDSPIMNLCEKIARRYLKVRIYHAVKLENLQKQVSGRQQLARLTIDRHE